MPGRARKGGLQAAAAIALAWLAAGCAGSGGGCKQDSDCPAGRYCAVSLAECRFDCSVDAECPEGYRCTTRGRCEPHCEPTHAGVEDCDGLDNDCDGQTDEELEVQACQRSNEHGTCAGERSCVAGAWSACSAAEPAAEDCNGLDDDCDGQTDQGLVQRDCPLTQGVCAGARQDCLGAAGWQVCDYGTDYEPGDEASCDGLDNDCDGQTDEGVDPLPDCEQGAEAADGLDNNCNGMADEPGGCMIRLPFDPVLIDAYEAVIVEEADCSGQRFGQAGDDYPADWPDQPGPGDRVLYACSLPGEIPSANLTWYQAQAACRAEGKRLCTRAEWATACGGSDQYWDFPYGFGYNPDICNSFSAGYGHVLPTGSLPDCVTLGGAYDMSGNLFEWMFTTCNWDPSLRYYQGGAYVCVLPDEQGGAPCDLSNPDHTQFIHDVYDCGYPVGDHSYCTAPAGTFAFVGFRCCLDLP